MRGPRTPWAALRDARRRLDGLVFGEIARRRRSGERGEDLLSLLLDATGEDGARLSDAHVRDEVMTLLFAGHDTTTATVAFLFRELALRPDVADAIAGELDGPLGYERLMGGSLVGLDRALDETLRLYPPAWIGPRRAVRTFEFEGVTVPEGAPVNYSSYVSHRLPDVWEAPHEFRPERSGAPRRAPEGRLRPVRRRLAPVHRDALRPAGDQGDRRPGAARAPSGARAGPPAGNQTNAHARAEGRPSDAGAQGVVSGVGSHPRERRGSDGGCRTCLRDRERSATQQPRSNRGCCWSTSCATPSG